MCIERYGNPRNRHVLTHSFPTRRASELERHAFGREQVQGRAEIDDRLEAEVRDEPGDGEEHEQILLRQQPREGAHDQKCEQDRKSTRLNSSYSCALRMTSFS